LWRCCRFPPSRRAPAGVCLKHKPLASHPHPRRATHSNEAPWTDPKWAGVKWTIYRGVAYDISGFVDRHPGGQWLINLAVGRDATGGRSSFCGGRPCDELNTSGCSRTTGAEQRAAPRSSRPLPSPLPPLPPPTPSTPPHPPTKKPPPAALFESYHLRHDVASAVFPKLPVLKGFPVHLVPQAPRPNDSALYRTIKDRVRSEVFAGGENRGAHRRGSELAALAVLAFAVASYCLFIRWTGFATGLLLGVAGAWIGVTIQHWCARAC